MCTCPSIPGFPSGCSKSACVSACTQEAPNLRFFLRRCLTNTLRRHGFTASQVDITPRIRKSLRKTKGSLFGRSEIPPTNKTDLLFLVTLGKKSNTNLLSLSCSEPRLGAAHFGRHASFAVFRCIDHKSRRTYRLHLSFVDRHKNINYKGQAWRLNKSACNSGKICLNCAPTWSVAMLVPS